MSVLLAERDIIAQVVSKDEITEKTIVSNKEKVTLQKQGLAGAMVAHNQLKALHVDINGAINLWQLKADLLADKRAKLARKKRGRREITQEELDAIEEKVKRLEGFRFSYRHRFVKAAIMNERMREEAQRSDENSLSSERERTSPDAVAFDTPLQEETFSAGEATGSEKVVLAPERLEVIEQPTAVSIKSNSAREQVLFSQGGQSREGAPTKKYIPSSPLALDPRNFTQVKNTTSVYQNEQYGSKDDASDTPIQLHALTIHASQKKMAITALDSVARDRLARNKSTQFLWRVGRPSVGTNDFTDLQLEDIRDDAMFHLDPNLILAVRSEKELQQIQKAYEKKYKEVIDDLHPLQKLVRKRIMRKAAGVVFAASMALGMVGDVPQITSENLTSEQISSLSSAAPQEMIIDSTKGNGDKQLQRRLSNFYS